MLELAHIFNFYDFILVFISIEVLRLRRTSDLKAEKLSNILGILKRWRSRVFTSLTSIFYAIIFLKGVS